MLLSRLQAELLGLKGRFILPFFISYRLIRGQKQRSQSERWTCPPQADKGRALKKRCKGFFKARASAPLQLLLIILRVYNIVQNDIIKFFQLSWRNNDSKVSVQINIIKLLVVFFQKVFGQKIHFLCVVSTIC